MPSTSFTVPRCLPLLKKKGFTVLQNNLLSDKEVILKHHNLVRTQVEIISDPNSLLRIVLER